MNSNSINLVMLNPERYIFINSVNPDQAVPKVLIFIKKYLCQKQTDQTLRWISWFQKFSRRPINKWCNHLTIWKIQLILPMKTDKKESILNQGLNKSSFIFLSYLIQRVHFFLLKFPVLFCYLWVCSSKNIRNTG